MKKLSKFQWHYNRLCLMSLPEILFRGKNIVQAKIEKFFFKIPQKKRQFKNIGNYYFKSTEHIENYYNQNPELKTRLFKNADNILNQDINWHGGYHLKFYADIDIKTFKDLDIKEVWELNRCQHLFPLAQAYVLSKEDKYLNEITNQISDWIDKNPYMTGVNWASPLEFSLRLISWTFCFFCIKDNISKDFETKLSTSIYQQTEFIYNHLCAFSSANDHLIAEAMGLCTIGTLFNFGEVSKKGSKKWQKKGLKVILKELEKQVFEDGLDKEQAFGYHTFVLEMFLTTFILLEKNSIKIIEKYWDKLEKMADCIAKFSDSELNLPNFGDSDDSFVLKLNNNIEDLPTQKIAKFLLNTSSVLFNRPDLKSFTKNELDENSLWLLDSNQLQKYFTTASAPYSRKSHLLEESGYLIIKDKGIDAYLDVGNLGYLSLAAHGHADALSFCLNYKGKKFLIDSGTYSYHADKELRKYFRSTKAHNTIEIDNLSQSQNGGDFMWLKKAQTFIKESSIKDENIYIKAHHNGYQKQGINVIHQRELKKQGKEISIIDTIINKDQKNHTYKLHWHTDTNCHVELTEPNTFKITNQDENIYLKITSDTIFKPQIILSLKSDKYTEKYESETIEITIESTDSFQIKTELYFD